MATTSTHPYGKIVAKQLEEKGIPVSYPLFAVFAPKFVEPDAKNQINANSNFHGEDTEFVGSITGVDTSTDEMLIRRVSNNSKDKGSLLVDGTNSNSKSRAMVRTKPTQFQKTNTDTSDATQKLKQQRKKRVPVFEIIANLRLSGSEIEPGRLIEVLRKIISVHSSRFDDDENSDLSRTLIVTNKPPNRRDNEILTTTSNSDEGNEDNEDNDNSSNSDEAESKKYDDDEIDIRKYFNDHEDTLATNFSSPE